MSDTPAAQIAEVRSALDRAYEELDFNVQLVQACRASQHADTDPSEQRATAAWFADLNVAADDTQETIAQLSTCLNRLLAAHREDA
jgi:hypothetical protein